MDRFRIVAVILDEQSVATRDPMIAREREQAIYDLLAQNEFRPFNSPGGPYRLILSVREGRLVFDIRLAHDRTTPHGQIIISLAPLRRVITRPLFFDRAVEGDPALRIARASRAMARMRLGRLHDGWDDYRFREARDEPFQGERWPASLAGRRIHVRAEQGVGFQPDASRCFLYW